MYLDVRHYDGLRMWGTTEYKEGGKFQRMNLTQREKKENRNESEIKTQQNIERISLKWAVSYSQGKMEVQTNKMWGNKQH